jgi:hypothetical protein
MPVVARPIAMGRDIYIIKILKFLHWRHPYGWMIPQILVKPCGSGLLDSDPQEIRISDFADLGNNGGWRRRLCNNGRN